jgi:hypothetical protein
MSKNTAGRCHTNFFQYRASRICEKAVEVIRHDFLQPGVW